MLLSSETRLPEDDQILVYNGKTLSGGWVFWGRPCVLFRYGSVSQIARH